VAPALLGLTNGFWHDACAVAHRVSHGGALCGAHRPPRQEGSSDRCVLWCHLWCALRPSPQLPFWAAVELALYAALCRTRVQSMVARSAYIQWRLCAYIGVRRGAHRAPSWGTPARSRVASLLASRGGPPVAHGGASCAARFLCCGDGERCVPCSALALCSGCPAMPSGWCSVCARLASCGTLRAVTPHGVARGGSLPCPSWRARPIPS
jgi:hypothetical protein